MIGRWFRKMVGLKTTEVIEGTARVREKFPHEFAEKLRHVAEQKPADDMAMGKAIREVEIAGGGTPRPSPGSTDSPGSQHLDAVAEDGSGPSAGVRNLPPLDELEIRDWPHGEGENYIVMHQDVPIGIYKPRPDAPQKITNEITAWESSELLGVGNVPYTREWIGPHGRGSLQEYVPNDGPAYGSKTPGGKGIAMFDYIRAGRDGKVGDVLKGLDGKMSRIDNAHIIPERTANDANYIGSSYVANNLGEPLPPDLVERVKQVTPDQYREFLQDRGYSPSASEWAAARLAEVQRGKITGSAWGCAIVNDITLTVAYPPGYVHMLQYWMDYPKLPGELRRDEM